MKKIIFTLFLMISHYSYSQTFEGSLIYKIDIEVLGNPFINGISKRDIIINDVNIPKDSIYFFYSPKGDFVSVYGSEDDKVIKTYIKKDKLLYTFEAMSTIVSAIDVSIDLEKEMGYTPTVKLLNETIQFQNSECSIVEVIWKAGIYRYYYKKDFLNINPDNYKGFEYDQWYNFLVISKALPVKIEKEINNFYKIILSLDNTVYIKFDDELLELPKMKKIEELGKIYPNKSIFMIEE